jgi:tellurite resistance protein TerC
MFTFANTPHARVTRERSLCSTDTHEHASEPVTSSSHSSAADSKLGATASDKLTAEFGMAYDTIATPGMWAGFILFVLAMLALDLGVFHRKEHTVGAREALVWSAVWISISLLFNACLTLRFGPDRGLEFLSGYLIEKSLSIDNIFVFVVIFAALRIPTRVQHRVLFWGILSALGLRAAMIFAGAALLERFHALFYVFGVFLIITGIRLFLQRNAEEHPEESWVMRTVRRFVPSTAELHGPLFFAVENGRRMATPLFMALVLIEVSDVIFAVDSIPAVFAVTSDPFIVFTSNIFAILGLRSMFFVLSGVMEKFRYLKPALTGVLIFVGAKMALVDLYEIHHLISLLVIALILGVAAVASLLVARREAVTSASQS